MEPLTALTLALQSFVGIESANSIIETLRAKHLEVYQMQTQIARTESQGTEYGVKSEVMRLFEAIEIYIDSEVKTKAWLDGCDKEGTEYKTFDVYKTMKSILTFISYEIYKTISEMYQGK